eukprot:5287700-Amphidinium_carterae.6
MRILRLKRVQCWLLCQVCCCASGMTFRKYLENAKSEWKAGKLTMGSKWWSRVDSLYSGGESEEPALSIDRFENVVQDELFKHFMQVMSDPPKREGIIGFANKSVKVSEMQYVILCKALQFLNMKGAGNQWEAGMAIIKCIHRCGCHETWSEVHAASFGTVDRWLLQVSLCISSQLKL